MLRTAMTIAIIGGTGDEGFGLALRLGKAGQDVVIGSRSTEKGQAAARRASELLGGTPVRGLENAEATDAADVVMVTVPFAGQADILKSIRDAVRPEAVVCDATSPLASAVGRPAWHVLTPWEGSAAEQARAVLRKGTRLVSGFQTMSGHLLQDLSRDLDADVPLCGDDPEAKATIGSLVERIPNLRWVDAGALSMARVTERLTALLISINRGYGLQESGFRITGRHAWGGPPARG
jgi:NADPH-dependent F420 reductase